MCLFYRLPGLTSLPSSQHPPSVLLKTAGDSYSFLAQFSCLVTFPAHNLALRWPSDIFLSCQGGMTFEPASTTLLWESKSELGNTVSRCLKTYFGQSKCYLKQPEYKLDLVLCNTLWPIYSYFVVYF